MCGAKVSKLGIVNDRVYSMHMLPVQPVGGD